MRKNIEINKKKYKDLKEEQIEYHGKNVDIKTSSENHKPKFELAYIRKPEVNVGFKINNVFTEFFTKFIDNKTSNLEIIFDRIDIADSLRIDINKTVKLRNNTYISYRSSINYCFGTKGYLINSQSSLLDKGIVIDFDLIKFINNNVEKMGYMCNDQVVLKLYKENNKTVVEYYDSYFYQKAIKLVKQKAKEAKDISLDTAEAYENEMYEYIKASERNYF